MYCTQPPEAERVCKSEVTVHVRSKVGSKDYLKVGTLHGIPPGWSQDFKSVFFFFFFKKDR